jgi:hypothetical protein
MKVRLTKKFADEIDGVDLSGRVVGDTLDIAPRNARLLLAEEWAAPERRDDACGRRTDDALSGGARPREQMSERGRSRSDPMLRERRFHSRRHPSEAHLPHEGGA